MRAGICALLLLFVPTAVPACRTPPHQADPFHAASFAALDGCAGQWATTCEREGAVAAWYENPTDRYPHGVLGDAIEAVGLRAYADGAGADSCGTKAVTLDDRHVFEDIAPRLADLDGDGGAEIITVRSHADKGAQLAIYRAVPGDAALRLVATTPYIGTRFRWLAPVGAADLDGDGHVEIAYVDRPHLTRRLRIWRFRNDVLVHVADHDGLTNHRIGDPFIPGGLRHCANGPELITADAAWRRVIASSLRNNTITTRDIGALAGPESLDAALRCP